MEPFTRAERDALLAAVVSAPAKPSVPGWGGYSLVTSSKNYVDGAWRIESAAPLASATTAACVRGVQDAVKKLARQLGLAIPTPIPGDIAYDGSARWWIVQAVVYDAELTPRVLATALPDIVLGTHFADIRGPFVAIVHWPPNANNDHSLCRVRAICLGADAWARLDAAVAEFRARVAGHRECVDEPFSIKVDARGTPMCARGANVYACMSSDYGLEEGTWSAELFASVLEDPALRALACASK